MVTRNAGAPGKALPESRTAIGQGGDEMPPKWYEYTFEDNIASYILAFLYSSQHVDVTVNLENLKRDLGEWMRKQELILTSSIDDLTPKLTKASLELSDIKKLLDAAEESQKKTIGSDFGLKKKEVMKHSSAIEKFKKEILKLRPKFNTDLRKEFEVRVQEALKTFLENQKKLPKESALPEDISLLCRLGEFTLGSDAPTWVEEGHYDTVAAAVVNKTLYVTCNYKTRTMAKVDLVPVLTYKGFGFPAEKLDALYKALNLELQVEEEPEILKIVFLRPSKVINFKGGSDEELQAYPHAEMQLVSYLKKVGKPKRIGVSKECCKKCADRLKTEGIRYLWDKDAVYENWADPDFIAMEILKEYNVSWL
jgi:hypothetical protein